MSEKWIKARDAWQKVFPGTKQQGGPNAIIRRTKSGAVRTRANSLVKSGPGEGKYVNFDLPAEFWGGHSMIPDWEFGDFSAKFFLQGRHEDWTAIGVTFNCADIDAMEPIAGAMVAAAQVPLPGKSKGGSPGKYDWAVAVGSLVFQWVDKGTWQPNEAKEVRTLLENHFSGLGQEPDEKFLILYAEWLFGEFEKRKV